MLEFLGDCFPALAAAAGCCEGNFRAAEEAVVECGEGVREVLGVDVHDAGDADGCAGRRAEMRICG